MQDRRIVLTGGPGGGKTTAADLFRREIGDRVVVVPEAATMLFSGGFPRGDGDATKRAIQSAIFHVQCNVEEAYRCRYPDRVLLCDRGTLDGAVYWPDSPEQFFAHQNTTMERELARYEAVLFFESAAVGGLQIEGGNPTRTEDTAAAAELDHQLCALWRHHPHFVMVPHQNSFFRKLSLAFEALEQLIN